MSNEEVKRLEFENKMMKVILEQKKDIQFMKEKIELITMAIKGMVK
jgi:hypothetical protein